jgi:hypothetical protein
MRGGVANKLGRILNHESFRQTKRDRRPAENYRANAKWCLQADGTTNRAGGILTDRPDSQIAEDPEIARTAEVF